MGKNKNKKVIEKSIKNEPTELSQILKITIGVVCFLILVYLIGALAKGEIKLGEKKEIETKIQYSEILAEQTFKQGSDSYYVLYYDFKDDYSMLYSTITSSISSSSKIYIVDLSKKFNANYITNDNVDLNSTTTISNLKIKDVTLIKIVNNKIEKAVNGKEKVVEYSKTIK